MPVDLLSLPAVRKRGFPDRIQFYAGRIIQLCDQAQQIRRPFPFHPQAVIPLKTRFS